MIEEWRKVKGTPTVEVSSFGRVISYWFSYFVSVLWMVIAVRGSLEKSEDWMQAGIIGSIWLLIAVVRSK